MKYQSELFDNSLREKSGKHDGVKLLYLTPKFHMQAKTLNCKNIQTRVS